jgi:hypothetical protein
VEGRSFEDGEHKSGPIENVRGADACVTQALDGGPHLDKLIRLLLFAATLKASDLLAGRLLIDPPQPPPPCLAVCFWR